MGKNNISVLAHADCCGCRACGDVCPVGCITFGKDYEGFYNPSVDETSCISCGKCVRSCPELNPITDKIADEAIAAYANSESRRQAGSSGGLFGLIAHDVISRRGKVWGAAFDRNLKLRHQSATTYDELCKLLRSKYLQSDTSGIYREILSDVRNGVLTLFSGTPCQCNAVRNIVGNTPQLVTVEVICHGVPSQDLFDKSIRMIENIHDSHITSFSFRSKFIGALHPQAYSYTEVRNGREHTVNGLHYQFPFYFGFQKYITLRRACYSCKWACPERGADITLGDFWGIEKYDSALNPQDGISMVLANTALGKELIERIIDEGIISAKPFPIEIAIENNGCMQKPTALKPARAEFFEALKEEPFEDVIARYLVPRRKWIFDIYYSIPGPLRRIVRKIMDKKMKYE